MPNLYPSDKTGGLDVYYVGMVWARALWDIRQILGRALTDSTLLSVYPALIGWAIDFETAAENLIDSFRRNPTVSAAQVRQVLEVFSNRNVISGRSVQAVAQTVDAAGAVTCYAGTPKELLRSGDGGVSWQSVALPAPAQVGRGGWPWLPSARTSTPPPASGSITSVAQPGLCWTTDGLPSNFPSACVALMAHCGRVPRQASWNLSPTALHPSAYGRIAPAGWPFQ